MDKQFEMTRIFNCKNTQEDCDHKKCDHYFVCNEIIELIFRAENEQKERDAVIAEGNIVPDGPDLINHEIANQIRGN
jgi:hypothetical protein